MSKKLLNLSILTIFLLLSELVMAQVVSVPYFCGFEDVADNSYWKMNVVSGKEKCNDEWFISNIDSSEGDSSLTISCDTGKTATFGVKRNMVVAYRRFSLDTTLSVNISFDWKCEGVADISQCYFYLRPASAISEAELQSLSHTADLPRKLARADWTMSGSLDWQNVLAFEEADLEANVDYYMIFVWQNASTDTLQSYSVSIDNIQITSSSCPVPENLQYKSGCDTLFISWDGYVEFYEFQYKRSGEKEWKTQPRTREKNMILVGIQEGAYDVRVRGISETTGEMSAWNALNEVICFCPDRHCINFVDLNRPGVECLWGEATNPMDIKLFPTGIGSTGAGAYDKGSRDIRSRHTVNWRQHDTDPRTGNKLRTIPEGHLASVRLGNWDVNKQAEGIEFEYEVDTTQADIILMKYAVVLEKPGHGPAEDPYFKLEILDETGMVVDPECGEFDFTPDNTEIQWNRCGGFVWKDWTAIGLNLSRYHGRNIKIRLMTQDCVRSAHCGYAYFTLDCVDASIKTTSCGKTIDIQMQAPEGFEYTWLRGVEREPVPGGDSAFISIPADDVETYYCRVSYVGIEGCGFELHTEVKPRFPHADFDWQWKPENCENKVVLTNKSCVHTSIDGVDTPTSEPCETFAWKIDDGTGVYDYISENVEYKVPKEGATLKVTLTSYISSGGCEDVFTDTIVVPAIKPDYNIIDTTICEGGYMQTDFGAFAGDTIAIHTEKSKWCGCDSTTELRLTVVAEPEEVHLYDTICEGQLYNFRGNEIRTGGEHRLVSPTVHGCDSIFVLHLDVIKPLSRVVLDDVLFACADDEKLHIGYSITDGARQPVEYSVIFSDLAKDNGFVDQQDVAIDANADVLTIDIPKDCRPNTYSGTFVFTDLTGFCGDVSIPFEFAIYYSASIMDPKFGNLIAVLDSSKNGGYLFVDNVYMWYKANGELLDSAARAFYYLPDGEKFDEDDCYYMIPTRQDDGVAIRTCEICPGIEGTPVEDVLIPNDILPITLFDKNQSIVIDNLTEGYAYLYSVTGQLISNYKITSDESMIEAPFNSGTYILRVVTDDYSISYKIRVR